VMFKAPKSDSGRTVDIPAELVPLLTDHLADHVGPAADALVFTSPEGRPLRRIKFRPRWAEACKCAGVSGLHFHDLRGSGCNLGSHVDVRVIPQPNVQVIHHWAPTILSTPSHLLGPVDVPRGVVQSDRPDGRPRAVRAQWRRPPRRCPDAF
jgi:integrase